MLNLAPVLVLLLASPSSPLVLQNARTVWDENGAHFAIDCADAAENTGRDTCGWGNICCALLPDGLDEALSVSKPGMFVATTIRNGLRIDGPVSPGEYTLTLRPPLTARTGSQLLSPFTAHVVVANRPRMTRLLDHHSVMAPEELERMRVRRGRGDTVRLRVLRIPAAQISHWHSSIDLTAVTADMETLADIQVHGPWDANDSTAVDLRAALPQQCLGVLVLEATAEGQRDAFFTRLTRMSAGAKRDDRGAVTAYTSPGATLSLVGYNGESQAVAVADAAGSAHLQGDGATQLLLASLDHDMTYVRLAPLTPVAPSVLLASERIGAAEDVWVRITQPSEGLPPAALVLRDAAGAQVAHARVEAAGPVTWMALHANPNAQMGVGSVALQTGTNTVVEVPITIAASPADGWRLETMNSPTRATDNAPTHLRLRLSNQRVAVANVAVALTCFARPGVRARTRAQLMAFDAAALASWQRVSFMEAKTDAAGLVDLSCAATASMPLLQGQRELLAVTDAHGPSGASLAHHDARFAVYETSSALSLTVVQSSQGLHIEGQAAPMCREVIVSADEVWLERAWNYVRGHETSSPQPRRNRLAQKRAPVGKDGFSWDLNAPTAQPITLVQARCKGKAAWATSSAASPRDTALTMSAPDTAGPGDTISVWLTGPVGSSVAVFLSAAIDDEPLSHRIASATQRVDTSRTVVAGDDEVSAPAQALVFTPAPAAWQDPYLAPDLRWLGLYTLGEMPTQVSIRLPDNVGAVHVHAVSAQGHAGRTVYIGNCKPSL